MTSDASDKRGVRLLPALGLIISAMMFGSGVYQLVVDVPNWSAALPESTRRFAEGSLAHATPTRYYAPLSLLALVIFGIAAASQHGAGRLRLLAAAAALVGNAVVTVLCVVPRNNVLFFSEPGAHTAAEIMAAAGEWQMFHIVRLMLLATALLCAALVMLRELGRRDVTG